MDRCPGDYFHATTWVALAGIAVHGLIPRRGAGLWAHGGYGEHSQGKVFLAKGEYAADRWFRKVADIAWDQYQDDREPDAMVPVLLRVVLDEDTVVHVDPVGDSDVPCSFYVEQVIPPEWIELWSPEEQAWIPVEDWEETSPESGVSSREYYDEDGKVVDESEWDEDTGSLSHEISDSFKPRWNGGPMRRFNARWGRVGSGLLFIRDSDESALLGLRSSAVLEPGTWGIPGGRVDGLMEFSGQPEEVAEALASAWREVGEELGSDAVFFLKAQARGQVPHVVMYEEPNFTYLTFVYRVEDLDEEMIETNWENDYFRWVAPEDYKEELEEPLHPGVKYLGKRGVWPVRAPRRRRKN